MAVWLKSIGAVVAGFASAAVVVLVLTWISAWILFGGEMTGPPTSGYLAFNLTYSFAAAVLAGWVAARLAPRAPFGHALVVVAGVMVLLSMGGDDGSQAVGVPAWYGTVITFFMPVGTVLGGWWRARAAPTGERAAGSS